MNRRTFLQTTGALTGGLFIPGNVVAGIDLAADVNISSLPIPVRVHENWQNMPGTVCAIWRRFCRCVTEESFSQINQHRMKTTEVMCRELTESLNYDGKLTAQNNAGRGMKYRQSG